MYLSLRDKAIAALVGVGLVTLIWAFMGLLFVILAVVVMTPFYLKVLFA